MDIRIWLDILKMSCHLWQWHSQRWSNDRHGVTTSDLSSRPLCNLLYSLILRELKGLSPAVQNAPKRTDFNVEFRNFSGAVPSVSLSRLSFSALFRLYSKNSTLKLLASLLTKMHKFQRQKSKTASVQSHRWYRSLLSFFIIEMVVNENTVLSF